MARNSGNQIKLTGMYVCMTSIKSVLKEIISKLGNKHSLHANAFSQWKETIINLIEERVRLLKERVFPRVVKSVINDPTVKQYLQKLHDSFVTVPIDKASNNVAFICKRFYALVLLKELGLLINLFLMP